MASNAVGEDSHSVALSVLTPPVFSRRPGDVALSKGERLTLACGAGGAPLPKISWAFNNSILPGSPISPWSSVVLVVPVLLRRTLCGNNVLNLLQV